MKKQYVLPCVEVKELYESISLLDPSVGQIKPGEIMSKESQFEDENETGIPDSYTSIWGDEEEKED